MNENKKMFEVKGVEKFSFMTFAERNNAGQIISFRMSCAADMIQPLPEKVTKLIEESGKKWFNVWIVKKNREACHNAIKIEDKAKYIIDHPSKVWLTKNAKGYLAFIVDCAPESIHKYEKEAKQNANETDLDDLPF